MRCGVTYNRNEEEKKSHSILCKYFDSFSHLCNYSSCTALVLSVPFTVFALFALWGKLGKKHHRAKVLKTFSAHYWPFVVCVFGNPKQIVELKCKIHSNLFENTLKFVTQKIHLNNLDVLEQNGERKIGKERVQRKRERERVFVCTLYTQLNSLTRLDFRNLTLNFVGCKNSSADENRYGKMIIILRLLFCLLRFLNNCQSARWVKSF